MNERDHRDEPQVAGPVHDQVTEQGSSRGATSIVEALSQLRSRARLVGVGYRLFMLLAIAIGIAAATGLLDAALRLPMWLRMIAWLVGIGGLVGAARIWIVPACRFNPGLIDLALRVEEAVPSYRGRLASAIDFARSGDASSLDRSTSPTTEALAAKVVDEVSRDWTPAFAANRLKPAMALKGGLWLTTILAALAGLAVMSPNSTAIGAARVLTPWAGVEWPSRTDVRDPMTMGFHPLGTDLLMRALVARSHRDWEDTDVSVQYRLLGEGDRVLDERRELLTWQRRAETGGQVYERLVQPSGETLEYRFVTLDDTTEWKRVDLIEPPAVVGARARITLPEYARTLQRDEGVQADEQGRIVADLGPGTDERAIAPRVLAGSRIEMTITLNKPVEVPASLAESIERSRAVGETAAPATIEADGSEWTVAWELTDPVRMPIELVDSYGIESMEPAVFRFDARDDRPAGATITEPKSDLSVLATAVLEVAGEARDDVGLRALRIERQRMTPAGDEGEPSGPGGAMEPVGDAAILARVDLREDETRTVAQAGATLDLSVIGVRAGDEVWLTAIASDVLTFVREGEETRSPVRVLRVISEETFIEQVRTALSDVRAGSIRAEEAQRETGELLERVGPERRVERGQSQIGERIERQRESIESISERIEQNGLNDRALEQMLEQAGETLERAGEASGEASEQVQEAGEQRERADEDPDAARQADEAEQRAQEAQEQVREELGRVIEMLDAGRDTWVVRNTIERLAQEQAALREQTSRLGNETAGLDVNELSDEQRSELERIVQRQQELAEAVRDLQEDIAEREENLREDDPASAEGLAQAGNRAQQERVAETQEQAAQEASQNNTSNANQLQEQAEEALQEMLEDLDAGQHERTAFLRRLLADAIRAIDALIAQQEAAIEALDERAAREPFDPAGLDTQMIALNQNSLGVVDQLRAGGSELAPVSNIVSQAAGAQERAVVNLRQARVEPERVREHETDSLELLREARALAEDLDQDLAEQERDRAQRELEEAYRALLRMQVALRDDTRRFAEAERLSRRDRFLVRQLGDTQDEIASRAAEILESIDGLSEATIFVYAHRRIERLSDRASGALRESEPGKAVRDQSSIIRVIEDLLAAVQDPEQDDDPFDEPQQSQQGGGGGSGGGGDEPLIPPVKELRLLRSLQLDVAGRTRELGDLNELDPADVRDLGGEQRELSDLGQNLLERLQGGDAPTGLGDIFDVTPDEENEAESEEGDDGEG